MGVYWLIMGELWGIPPVYIEACDWSCCMMFFSGEGFTGV
jgi:hypothetical protein